MKNASINYKKMQKPQLELARFNTVLEGLLTGKYSCLAKRKSSYRKSEWCIYAGNMSPVRYIGKRTFVAASVMLKEDKNGLHTLDLRKVRSLHGNCWLKKIYKKQLLQRKNDKV